jgi:hypothetical protein
MCSWLCLAVSACSFFFPFSRGLGAKDGGTDGTREGEGEQVSACLLVICAKTDRNSRSCEISCIPSSSHPASLLAPVIFCYR